MPQAFHYVQVVVPTGLFTGTRAVAALVSMAMAAVAFSGCGTNESQIMPDVTGMTLRQAVAVLAEDGIELEHTHGNYGVVKVLTTRPAAGDAVEGAVTFTMAKVTAIKVVDGDTLELSTGDTVRLIGVDTPELGRCGAAEATAFLTQMIRGRRIFVDPTQVENRDKYGRLLAYIGTPSVNDVGHQLLRRGLAVPRYDSSDGYGAHPAEKAYRTAARRATTFTCEPAAAPQEASDPSIVRRWTCFYSPTYDRDWHNDVLCSDGARQQRPYLRPWDSFVTEAEIMASAADHERRLNVP